MRVLPPAEIKLLKAPGVFRIGANSYWLRIAWLTRADCCDICSNFQAAAIRMSLFAGLLQTACNLFIRFHNNLHFVQRDITLSTRDRLEKLQAQVIITVDCRRRS